MAARTIRARGAVALGSALVVVAALFGLPSLYPVAVALIVLPLIAVAWVALSARRVHVRRSVPAGPLLEGEPGKLRVEVEGARPRPPGGELIDPLRPEPARFGPALLVLDEELSFRRRGVRRLGRASAVIRDPFGLSERRCDSAEAGELLVLPRPQPIHFGGGSSGRIALGAGARGAGAGGPDSWAAEFEIDGLRPYRDGTPASRIHWPTVARTGELHERRISAGADAARLIVVDPRSPAGEEELDAAVRAAASLCVELGRRGCSVLCPPQPRLVELDAGERGWPDLHARLAVLEANAGAPAVHRIGRAGLVVWVSADPSPRPLHELRRLQAGRRIIVRPEPAGGTGTLFEVAGCAGRAVGAGSRSPMAVAG